jgi:hypothetical protein
MILLGFLGDMCARAKMYGIELVVMIVGTIALVESLNHVAVGDLLSAPSFGSLYTGPKHFITQTAVTASSTRRDHTCYMVRLEGRSG